MATTFSCPRRPAGLGHLFFHFSYLGNWPSVASAWPRPLSRPLSQLLCGPSWGPWASQCVPQPPGEDGDPQQLFQKEESQAREVQQGRPSHSLFPDHSSSSLLALLNTCQPAVAATPLSVLVSITSPPPPALWGPAACHLPWPGSPRLPHPHRCSAAHRPPDVAFSTPPATHSQGRSPCPHPDHRSHPPSSHFLPWVLCLKPALRDSPSGRHPSCFPFCLSHLGVHGLPFGSDYCISLVAQLVKNLPAM